MVAEGLSHSMIKRAADRGIITVEAVDIRDFAGNKHNRVDDYPYGGGAGMVMMPQPVYAAHAFVQSKIHSPKTRTIYLTPQGRVFNQRIAEELAREEDLIFLCGHYEGIDERVIEAIVTDELSLGDFVMTGGELAAMAVIDTVSRLLPGVLNKEASYLDESFSDGLLEYPQYTRPPEFMGKKVPEVLLSGHHENINKWRKEESRRRTAEKRPDLLRGENNAGSK
jgi:tRNA (guanine37-N1)-methyltransferase